MFTIDRSSSSNITIDNLQYINTESFAGMAYDIQGGLIVLSRNSGVNYVYRMNLNDSTAASVSIGSSLSSPTGVSADPLYQNLYVGQVGGSLTVLKQETDGTSLTLSTLQRFGGGLFENTLAVVAAFGQPHYSAFNVRDFTLYCKYIYIWN
jgi:DNA-binding beta-propeller fold protein YncE